MLHNCRTDVKQSGTLSAWQRRSGSGRRRTTNGSSERPRVIRAATRDNEPTSDVIRRALRLLEREVWLSHARADAERLAEEDLVIRGAVYRVDLGDAKRRHEQRGRRYGQGLSYLQGDPVHCLNQRELAGIEHAVTRYLGR